MTDVQRTPVAPSTRQYVRRIETQLKRALEGLFEVGQILTEAKNKLDRKAWLTMVDEELPFTRRTAEKFIKISADPRLRQPEVINKLPPKWTSLHELTYLDDEQLDHGIATGAINPDAERKDIKALHKPKQVKPKQVSDGRSRRKVSPKKLPHIAVSQISADTRGNMERFVTRDLTLATVCQPDPLDAKDLVEFQQEFESLCRKYGLEPQLSDGTKQLDLLVLAQKRLRTKHEELRHEALSNPTEAVEAAFFQLETGTSLAPLADGDFHEHDLRNPDNEFREFDLEQLYGYCLDAQLLTRYTPIEFLDVQSFVDVQTVQVLTGTPREQRIAVENLEHMAKSNKQAQFILKQLNV